MSELRMALTYGPELGAEGKWHEAIDKVIDGSVSMDLHRAARAEKTKEGTFVRATASADEVLRSWVSETLIPIKEQYWSICAKERGSDKISVEQDFAHIMQILASDP